jgi:hypothetical protein
VRSHRGHDFGVIGVCVARPPLPDAEAITRRVADLVTRQM